ncbi:hypothetical protein J4E80_000069 [Alternaria sp. BMP 0032]|nr:hypothetical protein J4E80_000069 [Alternaria sp. BMP 0032]
MALSSPASDTAVPATSTPDADLSSALGIFAMQDPSIPTPGECHIDRCAIEIMIQVAESLDDQSLCSLARASKRYPEAAQDVLYRFADLRPAQEELDEFQRTRRPIKSRLAVFLWTIRQKPHLATKVRDLWLLPRSTYVEFPQLRYSTVSLLFSKVRDESVMTADEPSLAYSLLARLNELRSLTITALDDDLCHSESVQYVRSHRSMKINDWITVFDKLPIRSEKLVDLPCFSKLTSIYLSHGHLDWAIITLPTLHTLCMGSKATVQLPSKLARALNITSLTIEAGNNAFPSEFMGKADLLVYLPNVKALTLGSSLPNAQHSRFPPQPPDRGSTSSFGNLGSFTHYVKRFLAFGCSVESLKLTYTKPARFSDTTTTRLEAKEFIQLRRIEIAECALVDSHDLQRLEGSSPSQLLPRRIQTLVITHPRSPGPDDGDRKSKLASWLGELTKTDFPDLERVEVVCSVGYGDDMGFKQRLEQSAEVRFLETIGVAVVVRKE